MPNYADEFAKECNMYGKCIRESKRIHLRNRRVRGWIDKLMYLYTNAQVCYADR